MPSNPKPTLAAISPTQILSGTAFTLTVTGTNFIPTSKVHFGVSTLATTFLNSTTLTAVVPSTIIEQRLGTKNVHVTNPAPGGGSSNVKVFEVYGSLIKVVSSNLSTDLVIAVTGDKTNSAVVIPANITGFDLGAVLSGDQLNSVQSYLARLVGTNSISIVSSAPALTYNVETGGSSESSNSSPFIKAPVRLASITPLSPVATYNNGVSGIGATLTGSSNSQLIVDGTLANIGDRILVAGETVPSHNGIYTVTNIGQSGAASSVSFPTNSDYSLVSDPTFADALPNLSASMWVKTSSSAACRLIGKTSDATANGGWSADILTGGQFAFTLWQPNDQFQYVTATVAPFNDGAWHNFAMTYDSVNGSVVYIDGVLVPQTSNSPIPGTNYSSPDLLGMGNWDTYAGSLVGNITHIQIWNTTLAPSDVAILATGGSVSTGLIASWAFAEGVGTTAADSIGGNTLFFTNVNWIGDAPSQLGAVGSAYILNRATDFNTWNDVPSSLVTSLEGVAEANSEFLNHSSSVGTIGTTAITFSPLVTLVPPRLTATQISAVQNPTEGMMVWNLTTHTINAYDGTSWKAVTLS